MSNVWQILKFYLPPELEGFINEQEKLIKEFLEGNGYGYKFISKNTVFLSNDNINLDNISSIEYKFKEFFRDTFESELDTLNIEETTESNDSDWYYYKFIFSDKIQIEYLDIGKTDLINGLEEASSVDNSIEENCLLFRSKDQQDISRNKENSTKQLTNMLFKDIDIKLEIVEKKEIVFSFRTSNRKEEDIIKCIQSSEDIEIVNEDIEYNLIKEIEYQNMDSDKPLVHDLRKENIIVGQFKVYLDIGLFFLGYMRIDKDIYLTIKTFEYEVLENLVQVFRKKITVESNANLLWERLKIRYINGEYHEKRKNLVDNQLCKEFLETSKKDTLSEYNKYVIEKVLRKGYLTEEEYSKKDDSLDAAIKDNKSLSQFLQMHFMIDNVEKQYNSYWINSLSNKVYAEKKSKTDPQRIIDKTNEIRKIYAPTEQLLEYIKCYWHQNYVKLVIEEIQKDWKRENKNLQITDIKVDQQFNLRTSHESKETSIDIDVLVRLKEIHRETKEEYIIAIEAKQKSSELISAIKELNTNNKITYQYGNILDGFLMIAYLDDLQEEIKMKLDEVEYSQVIFKSQQESEGMTDIIKPYYLSVNNSFNRLKEEVKLKIRKICEKRVN